MLTLSIISFVISCGPSTYVTGSWRKPGYDASKNDYKKLFVAVMAQDLDFRDRLEKDVAAAATKRGLASTLSLDIFPPNMTRSQLPPKEELAALIAKTGSDLIMTVAIKDVKEETRYVPGSGTTYAPYGPGGFYGYYGGGVAYSYSPGYYTTDKIIYLETNIFDVKTEELIWSAQSTTTNPSSFESFSREYIYAILQRLKKDGMLKPSAPPAQ